MCLPISVLCNDVLDSCSPCFWVVVFRNRSLSQRRCTLLSPSSGWIESNDHLYWTRNGGSDWLDITPSSPNSGIPARVNLIYFRDASEGWSILSYEQRDLRPAGAPVTVYDLAHTVDSGATWSVSRVSYPPLPNWIQVETPDGLHSGTSNKLYVGFTAGPHREPG